MIAMATLPSPSIYQDRPGRQAISGVLYRRSPGVSGRFVSSDPSGRRGCPWPLIVSVRRFRLQRLQPPGPAWSRGQLRGLAMRPRRLFVAPAPRDHVRTADRPRAGAGETGIVPVVADPPRAERHRLCWPWGSWRVSASSDTCGCGPATTRGTSSVPSSNSMPPGTRSPRRRKSPRRRSLRSGSVRMNPRGRRRARKRSEARVSGLSAVQDDEGRDDLIPREGSRSSGMAADVGGCGPSARWPPGLGFIADADRDRSAPRHRCGSRSVRRGYGSLSAVCGHRSGWFVGQRVRRGAAHLRAGRPERAGR